MDNGPAVGESGDRTGNRLRLIPPPLDDAHLEE